MARYTLPSRTTATTITFLKPSLGSTNTSNTKLTVCMGFDDQTRDIDMWGLTGNTAFADGVEIIDTSGTLTKLKLVMASPPADKTWSWAGWSIECDGRSLSSPDGLCEYAIAPQVKEWITSVIISYQDPSDPSSPVHSTGDPKIKVIRPSL
ncbi:hypothetical protein ACNOYE_03445 [Nannocystaceae bacterium ST9]